MDPASKRKHIIITPGRTGSSLLSAILIDAGANFGLNTQDEWDPATGAHEHLLARRASYFFRKAHALSQDRPATPFTKYLWDYYRHRGKKALRSLLPHADFLKAGSLDLAVQPVFQAGYFPSIILNYRRFENHAISHFSMRTYFTMETLAGKYNRVFRNGILQMHLYGGCPVGYDELRDPKQTSWANALAEVTGLSRDKLLKAREKYSKIASPDRAVIEFDDEATRLFNEMESLSGQSFAMSAQALRNWRRKHEKLETS